MKKCMYNPMSLRKRLIFFLILALSYFPSSGQVYPDLIFANPQLVSGTNLAAGAVYKFSDVATGVDAFVSIDSLRDGALIRNIDSVGTGHYNAFQPIISSQSPTENSYARFTVTFRNKAGALYSFPTLAATGIDIDGSANIKEFHIYNMGGGTVDYESHAPELEITSIGTSFKAKNVAGIEKEGIDTLAREVMFTVRNTNVSSMTIILGSVRTSGSGYRNISVLFKDFSYNSSPSTLSTLPVSLASFSANLRNQNVGLKWTSVTEINFSHYEIERSFDGNEYNKIAVVLTSGNSFSKKMYNYSDNISDNNKTLIYYRLKMVDIDGTFKYSDVRVIRIGKQPISQNIITYPNPVINEVRVTIPSNWQNKEVRYNIYNNSGQIVMSRISNSASQTEVFNMSNLGRGFYILNATNGIETAQQKIIKQ